MLYDRRMDDDWLAIPKDRKSLPVLRLCVIMALTALLFVVTQARQGTGHPPADKSEVPTG